MERIINMTRYLIRESVQCGNLASHVLGMCGQRVARDFHARYGMEPWLMETFVDLEQYAGTCFQAANWLCVGQTKGRERNGGNKEGKSIKDVYMYPLVQDFRARMGVSQTQNIEPLALESGLESDQWAKQEFAGCELGNQHRTEQLVKIAENKGRHPSASYSRACGGNRHTLKGYYRLINNADKRVSSHAFMGGHREQTIRRMAGEKTALIVQDTMDMNFSARLHCKDLGLIKFSACRASILRMAGACRKRRNTKVEDRSASEQPEKEAYRPVAVSSGRNSTLFTKFHHVYTAFMLLPWREEVRAP